MNEYEVESYQGIYLHISLGIGVKLSGSVELGGNHLIEGRCGGDDFSVCTA